MQENKTICYCTGITYEDLKKCYEEDSKDLTTIRKITGAGIICGRCVKSIEQVIKEFQENN